MTLDHLPSAPSNPTGRDRRLDIDLDSASGPATDAEVRLGPRARLNPQARVLWRDPDCVQLELGEQSIVLENVTSSDIEALLGSDPRRPTDRSAHGDGNDEVDRLRPELASRGFMIDRSPGRNGTSDPAALPARLGADRAALAAGIGPAADAVFSRRRQSRVSIHGTSRLAVALATTLAAAGVGALRLVNAGVVRAVDIGPGGMTTADEARPFLLAATDAVHRVAPETECRAISPGEDSSLAILTESGPFDTIVRDDLHRRSATHLMVSVDGRHAVVGPLVVPGVSSCLRCADLHRTDRDPAWPLLAVQLANRPAHRAAADGSLTVATAGLAAAQALLLLDRSPGQAEPSTMNATVEWRFPGWQLRRRSWPFHPDCECRLPRGGSDQGRMVL